MYVINTEANLLDRYLDSPLLPALMAYLTFAMNCRQVSCVNEVSADLGPIRHNILGHNQVDKCLCASSSAPRSTG